LHSETLELTATQV